MKEGMPITPLSEEEIAERPKQLSYALSQIKLAEEVVLNSPNNEHVMEGCIDGKKVTLVTDPVVVQAMKGGAERMYEDVKTYYDGLAETLRSAYVPSDYEPPFKVASGKIVK